MKFGKKCISLVLALVMVLGLTVSASAAAPETVTVQLSPNITVKLDGEIQTMTDVNGNPVYPVLYGGTTYLPIRAVGNMLGLDVDWDGATQTVILEKADGKTAPAKTGNKAPANAKPTEITVQINPNITVKLDGKTQKMANVNGDPVYPMLYGGTTYLPVRAVSNMLGVAVNWDGSTQTVSLGEIEGSNVGVLTPDGGMHIVDKNDPEAIRETLLNDGWSENEIDQLIVTLNDPFTGAKTSEEAKVLGKDHIGYDYSEIDWSTASDGYVRVKVDADKNMPHTIGLCYVRYDNNGSVGNYSYRVLPNQWTTIPLYAGSTEYVVTINRAYVACEHNLTEAELEAQATAWQLTARFDAEINDPDAMWLLSSPLFDFENAPETRAKALELTRNCKTDAEKITVIFNYVASTIKYDYQKAAEIEAAKNNTRKSTCFADPVNGEHYDNSDKRIAGDLDDILTVKTGVCTDYAALMTGMLRSLGIPCKYVSGTLFSDGNWAAHVWVAVKPETGTLNKSALGAGTDYAEATTESASKPTDWIRLDPTNAHVPATTSNDSKYLPHVHY